MGRLKPFFQLTPTFFGLTSKYKPQLLEEVFLFTQHIKGFSYSDVMNLPVQERRFFLGEKLKEIEYKQNAIDETENNTVTSNGSKTRTSKVSGKNLKNMIKNGDIPIN